MVSPPVVPVVAGLAVLTLGGCGFFRVPEDVAVPVSTRPIKWLINERCSRGLLPAPSSDDLPLFDSPGRLDGAIEGFDVVSEEGAARPAGEGHTLISRFLHVADAQIRDDRLYALTKDKDPIFLWDTPPVIRNTHVYSYDSLVYASFLIAYAKGVKSDKNRPPEDGAFIVDGGDLLDICVITELVEVMNIRRHVANTYQQLAVYSSCGNHDSLTWGNLRDEWTDTRGLGVNRAEFVLGHLLADPVEGRGWGFGRNEIVDRFGRDGGKEANEKHLEQFEELIGSDAFARAHWAETGKWKDIARWLDDIKDAARERRKLRTLTDKQLDEAQGAPQEQGQAAERRKEHVPLRLLHTPMTFREAIRTTSEGDRVSPGCGYYSWPDAGAAEPYPPIRYIVLDTRSGFYRNGRIDVVQLGWFYNELVEANRLEQLVVIFAHHAPDRFNFWEPNWGAFQDVLRSFPNIIAYFHGHDHWNDERCPQSSRRTTTHGYGSFPLIQTASVNDFPQTAREVWIFKRDRGGSVPHVEVTLWWQHIRPQPVKDSVDGRLLDACLGVSRRGSKKDYNDCNCPDIDSIKQWEKEHLQCGTATVYPRFLEPTSRALNPRKLLGGWLADKINDRRTALGLPPLRAAGISDR